MESPLKQFLVKKIFPITFGGVDISLTNSSLCMLISCVLVCIFFLPNTKSLVPTRRQILIEEMIRFIKNLVQENLPSDGQKYLSFILSLFIFILCGNLLGMVPFAFTFTSQIITTLTFGFMVFCLMTGLGFAKHGVGFLRKFCPSGVPAIIQPIIIFVEVISFLFRPITLGVRLFANILAGHVVLKIFTSFTVLLGWFGVFPLLTNVIFTCFEFFVACLQAYIFTILSCSYINDVLTLDH